MESHSFRQNYKDGEEVTIPVINARARKITNDQFFEENTVPFDAIADINNTDTSSKEMDQSIKSLLSTRLSNKRTARAGITKNQDLSLVCGMNSSTEWQDF